MLIKHSYLPLTFQLCEVVKSPTPSQQANVTEKPQKDQIDKFADLLAMTMRQVPAKKQYKLQAKIMKLVYETIDEQDSPPRQFSARSAFPMYPGCVTTDAYGITRYCPSQQPTVISDKPLTQQVLGQPTIKLTSLPLQTSHAQTAAIHQQQSILSQMTPVQTFVQQAEQQQVLTQPFIPSASLGVPTQSSTIANLTPHTTISTVGVGGNTALPQQQGVMEKAATQQAMSTEFQQSVVQPQTVVEMSVTAQEVSGTQQIQGAQNLSQGQSVLSQASLGSTTSTGTDVNVNLDFDTLYNM
jgi:hypothetical protein